MAYPLAPQYRPLNAATSMTTVARADYAANGGDSVLCCPDGPASLQDGDTPTYNWNQYVQFDQSTGVIFQRSQIRIADIRDGCSNTYLAGEKYLDPDHYLDGADGSADDGVMFEGFDSDVARWTNQTPTAGSCGHTGWPVSAAPHAAGCNMAFCDGSVRSISYSINLQVHGYLGNRNDGQPIDASKF